MRRTRINIVPVTAINGVVQALPENPNRVAIICPVLTGVSYGIGFDSALTATTRLSIDSGSSPLVLLREQLGDGICQPLFVQAGAGFGMGFLEVTEVCDCPEGMPPKPPSVVNTSTVPNSLR